MKRKHKKRSVAPDPGGDGYGYLRRRGLSRREIAKGHNQGVGHNSGKRNGDDEKNVIDVDKPLPYPVTKPRGSRPSLGSGMAEDAAKDVEGRGDTIDSQIDRAMGRNDDDEDD